MIVAIAQLSVAVPPSVVNCVSVIVVADTKAVITADDEPLLNIEQPGLIDWSEKMAEFLNTKMNKKLREIIIQAEESRLLETKTRQFAENGRLGGQPEIGNSDTNFLDIDD